MNNIFDLTGKNVIVTGGYGHLGTGIVRALSSFNANVIVAGLSDKKFSEAFNETEKGHACFRALDIMQKEKIEIFFKQVLKEFGTIDILINNAHSAKGVSQENMSEEDWAYTLDGILGSVHRCIKAVIPAMKKQHSGKIINISSMYGIVSPDFNLYSGDDCEKFVNPPHYGAAKAAINQLTRYFAVLLGSYNVQVNAIAPGPFPNYSIQEENPEFIERLKKKNPLGKIGKPSDIAGITVLLSSAASDFITGQTIQVDGGWTIW